MGRRLVSIRVSAFLARSHILPPLRTSSARASSRARGQSKFIPFSPSKFDGICAEGACSRRERGANTPRRSRAQPTNPPAPAADHRNFLTRILDSCAHLVDDQRVVPESGLHVVVAHE